MAKKTVATIQRGEGRSFAKVIKMVKSPKTGAYMLSCKCKISWIYVKARMKNT